jgi:hypothetical protein
MDRIVSINRTTWAMSAIFLAVALVTSVPGHAQAYQFVRVTCVPANGYLEVEYKTVEQEVFEGATHAGRTFADNGYLDPQAADSECKLGTALYVVSSRQEPPHATGTCGAAPPIILTLRRNKSVLIDHVAFGDTCNGEPSITRLWLHEDKATETPAEMSLCIAPRITDFGARAPDQVCPYLTADKVTLAMPVTSYRIEGCTTRKKEDTCLMPDSTPSH